MNKKVLLSIQPKSPSGICGTSGFAYGLGEKLSKHVTVFFGYPENGEESTSICLIDTKLVNIKRNSMALMLLLFRVKPDIVILHYSPFGLSWLGIPFYLIPPLYLWKWLANKNFLMTYVHETSPTRSSRFFKQFLDQLRLRCISELLRISDSIVTNTYAHRKRLAAVTRRDDIYVCPVMSNIAKTSVSKTVGITQEKLFLIFGLPHTQMVILKQFERYFSSWIRAGLMERILIVGEVDRSTVDFSKSFLPEDVNKRIEWTGRLSETDVSSMLALKPYCLTYIDGDSYTKSGSFMAYALHECPIVTKERYRDGPLRWTMSPQEVGALPNVEIQTRTRRLYDWYMTNADIEVTSNNIIMQLPLTST